MKRFLSQSYKLAAIESGVTTGTASTTVDAATYMDAEGFTSINVLSRIVSTTDDPTIKLSLLAASSTGGGSATTVCSTSWTGGTTGDHAMLAAPTNSAGADFHFFAVKITSNPGGADKVKAQNLYFLGGPRRSPIAYTTGTTDDSEHHITTVKGSAVATS